MHALTKPHPFPGKLIVVEGTRQLLEEFGEVLLRARGNPIGFLSPVRIPDKDSKTLAIRVDVDREAHSPRDRKAARA